MNDSVAKKVRITEQNLIGEIFCMMCCKDKNKVTKEKQALWNQCNGNECDRWACVACFKSVLK